MILLDTHAWIWWAHSDSLPTGWHASIQAAAPSGLAVSAISCWEVCKLVELKRLQLSLPVEQWLALALQPPIVLLPLSPEIDFESTRLPGTFQRDPADQIIVATARHYDCPLLTSDGLIRQYPHVKLAV